MVVSLLVAVGAAVGSLVAPMPAVSGAAEVGVDPNAGGDGIDTHVGTGDPGTPGGDGTSTPGGSGRGGGPTLYRRVDVDLVPSAFGGTCAYVSFSTTQDANQAGASFTIARSLVAQYGLCFGSPTVPDGGPGAGPGPPAGPPVERLWRDEVPLPDPVPRIAPGRAIVGLPAYLEIDGAATGTWHFDELGYAIDITATSTYDVEWGDGTVDLAVTGVPGPYPTGTIRHSYQRADFVDVAITQRWTATWTAVGPDGTTASGTIADQLITFGELDDFAVQGVQAVRSR